MRIRTAAEAEAGSVANFIVDEPVSWITRERFDKEYAEQRFRPEWTWIAEDDDGRIVARALWWGRSDSEHPVALDCLHVLGSVEDRSYSRPDTRRSSGPAPRDGPNTTSHWTTAGASDPR